MKQAQDRFKSMPAGDVIRLCRGGSFRADGLSRDWDNPRCQPDNRCRIEAYTPPEVSAELPSPLVRRKTGSMFGFATRRNSTTRGVDILQIDVICEDCGTRAQGIRIGVGAGDMTFDQIKLDGFSVNFMIASKGGTQSNITLKNSRILNGRAQGVLGGGPNLQILDNYFENNGGPEHMFDHSIYINGDSNETGPEIPYNILIRGNEIYKTSPAGGSCSGSIIVGHGYLNGIIIEENFIHEDPGTASGPCHGIELTPAYSGTEEIENVIVRRNLISNVGKIAIWIGATRNVLVENNVVVDNSLQGDHISIYLQDFDENGRSTNEDVTIRNNSAFIADSPNARFVQLDEGARRAVIANNVAYIGNAQKNGYCFRLQASSVAQMDNNLCRLTGIAEDHWVSSGGALAEWQAQTGFDQSSLMGLNPQFEDPSELNLSPASPQSPLAGAGSSGLASGDAMPACTPLNQEWVDSCGPPPLRGTDPDIGAYQLNASGVVAKPPAAPILVPLEKTEH
jgi:hypothetical protein